MIEQNDMAGSSQVSAPTVSKEELERISAGLAKLQGDVSLAQELWNDCKTFGIGAAYPEGRLHKAVEDGLMTARMIALMVEVGNMCDGVGASEAGRRGGQARAAKVLADKQMVYDCWSEWQREPKRYRSQARFAKDMLEKCENVESDETIKRWCRDWKKISNPSATVATQAPA